MEPDDLLCSRNARPPKALVGRAQWKINQPPSLKRLRASLDGLSVTSLDGRSRKLLTPSLGWVMNWERVSIYARSGRPHQPPR